MRARRAGCSTADAPAALLRSRCAARLRAAVRRPTRRAARARTRGARRLAPLALAASLVLVVGGAFVYQATDKSARVLAAELTADHVKCFAMNRVLGTHASRRGGRELDGSRLRLAHAPAGRSERKAGLELVGSRPCLYGEGKIAHIMYRHKGTRCRSSCCRRRRAPEELVEVLGHEAAIWCVGDRTFVLVAREPRAEVERMASFVQASLR